MTLRVATLRDATSLDPALVSDSESMDIVAQIFEPLVQMKGTGGAGGRAGAASSEVVGVLAESWQVASDLKSWTFKLRGGVRFHDGAPLTADDVVFSYERLRDPGHPYHFQKSTYWESTLRSVTRVEKLGPHSVRIHLQRPFALFLKYLSLAPAGIVSSRAVKQQGAGFGTRPSGTGPFRLARWIQGSEVKLVRNGSYWGAKPHLDELIFDATPDEQQRLMALESKQVDVAMGLSTSARQFVRLYPGLSLVPMESNSVAYLAMNTSRPPLDDVRVRRAINLAVNREAIVKLVFQGMADPAIGPVPPGVLGHNEQVARYPHDPAGARRMLAEAGVDLGKRFKLYVMSTPRPYLPAPILTARIVKRNLEDVGLGVDLVIAPFPQHQRATQMGEHDLCLAGWTGDIKDPDTFLYMLLDRDNARLGAARNLSMFTDEQVHDRLVRAREAHLEQDRLVLYREAQEIIARQAPWVPLAHMRREVAVVARVRRLSVLPSFTIAYQGVELLDAGGRP